MGWLRALRWPAYRRVWTVSTLQQFGYWFSNIPFQWLVARETGSDPLALSFLYFCMLIPMLVFALPAGALADVRDRRRIILVAQLSALVVGCVTALLVFADRAPFVVLLAAGFACGLINTFGAPASQALTANAVPAEDLRSGVLVLAVGQNLSRIVGPGVAGMVILAWGAADSLIGYAVIGATTALALLGLNGVADRPRPTEREPLVARIRSGIAHVREHPPAGVALSLVAATSLFGLSYMAQLPALAARVSPDPSAFLLLTTVGAVGSLGGILIVALRAAPRATVTPAALMLVAQGLVLIGFALATTLWALLPLIVVAGAMQFGIMTQCGTVIQEVVDDDFRGRVMSLYVLCWGGLLPIGGLVLGTVWHLFGAVAALGGSGLVALACGCFVLRPGAVRSTVWLNASTPTLAPENIT